MKTEHEEAVRLADKHNAENLGVGCLTGLPLRQFNAAQLAALIAEVRRETVEECAKICDGLSDQCDSRDINYTLGPAHCADTIRAKHPQGEWCEADEAISALESAEAENAELKKEAARKADLARHQRKLEAQLQGEVNDLEAENAALRETLSATEARYAELHAMHHEDQAQVAELEAMVPRWVPVSERLPKDAEGVLVHGGVAYQIAGIWFTAMGADEGRPIQWDVTHWMPLPQPPEVNND